MDSHDNNRDDYCPHAKSRENNADTKTPPFRTDEAIEKEVQAPTIEPQAIARAPEDNNHDIMRQQALLNERRHKPVADWDYKSFLSKNCF